MLKNVNDCQPHTPRFDVLEQGQKKRCLFKTGYNAPSKAKQIKLAGLSDLL